MAALAVQCVGRDLLLAQHWWQTATTGVRGVSRHHEQVVSFAPDQLCSMLSPANFLHANPEVLQATFQLAGKARQQRALCAAANPRVGQRPYTPVPRARQLRSGSLTAKTRKEWPQSDAGLQSRRTQGAGGSAKKEHPRGTPSKPPYS
jgi:hypothetical protein